MDYELEDMRGARATPQAVAEVTRLAGDWMTRTQIAHALGLKVTPSLISAIEALVQSGSLWRGRSYRPNGSIKYSYMYHHDADWDNQT